MDQAIQFGGNLVQLQESSLSIVLLGVLDLNLRRRSVPEDHVEGLIVPGESIFESV